MMSALWDCQLHGRGLDNFFKLLLNHLFSDFSVAGGVSGKFVSALILELLWWWPYCCTKQESRTVRLIQKAVLFLWSHNGNCSCMKSRMVWRGRRTLMQNFLNFDLWPPPLLRYNTGFFWSVLVLFGWFCLVFCLFVLRFADYRNQRNVFATDVLINKE